jgi:hypothetical protein
MHRGYVYTADRTRGVDVLRLTSGVRAAASARRAVAAPASSERRLRFLRRQATRFKADPGTAFIYIIDRR